MFTNKEQAPGTPGCVYLMRCRSGCYKIGRAIMPEPRLLELRYKGLDVEELTWSLFCGDAVTTERAMQQRFAAYYIGRDEMFNLPQEDVAWICRSTEVELCAEYDPRRYRRPDSKRYGKV